MPVEIQTWTGNRIRTAVRDALRSVLAEQNVSGETPVIDRQLLDQISRVIQKDERGGTIREWRFAHGQLMPVFRELAPEIVELVRLRRNGSAAADAAFPLALEAFRAKFQSRIERMSGSVL